MNTDEIVKLSRQSVASLIQQRLASGKIEQPYAGPERRRAPRWPFPGQVEVRLAGDDHSPPLFFECRDLSESGLGMCGSRGFEIGDIVEISLHLPEATLYGQTLVRYCMKTHRGFMIGVEFRFDD